LRLQQLVRVAGSAAARTPADDSASVELRPCICSSERQLHDADGVAAMGDASSMRILKLRVVCLALHLHHADVTAADGLQSCVRVHMLSAAAVGIASA